jgi:hypothetical protein
MNNEEPKTTEMKQTAVEWLAEKYNYITWMRNRDEISAGTADEWRAKYLEQAKEIEKQQHEKFNNFLNSEKKLGIADLKSIERIQWYYNTYFNETYGGDK